MPATDPGTPGWPNEDFTAVAPGAARHATTGTLRRDGLRGVGLLSDGATRITDLYHLLSWPAAIDVVRDHGPAELVRQVRRGQRPGLRALA